MSNAHLHASERLSAEDAIFLYVETKDMPLHIASVMIFDGPIPLKACTDLILSKLPLIPRYRQRIVVPPFNIGHPTWEFDPQFDIHNHIRQVQLKHGTEADLQAVTGQILSEIMDRNKPLWDLTLVDGLKGRRSAMIARVHHCLVDGVAGVALLSVLLDGCPPPTARKIPARIPPLPDPITSLLDGIVSAYGEMLDRIFSAQAAALNVAETMIAQGVPALTQMASLVPDLLKPLERLPFNKPCLGARKLVWTEVSIPEVKAIREVLGGTLNDVVLTVVTAAIRQYAQLHHSPIKGRMLRLMVPVNLRPRDPVHAQNGMGNRVGMLPVNTPLDIHDPVKLLDAIRMKTEVLKRTPVADFIGLAGNWIGMIPAPLQAVIGPLAPSLLPVPLFNMVCTNVPGPQYPLRALGREMLTYYPYVPIGAEMGVCCAVESYNGKLYFGFTGSEAAAPDVDVIPHLLDAAFAELREAAGVAPIVQKRKKAVKRRRPAARPIPEPGVETRQQPVATMVAAAG